MNYGIKKLLSILLVLCLCVTLGSEGGFAAALDHQITPVSDQAGGATSAASTDLTDTHHNSDIQTISNAGQLSEVIQEHWNDSYFGKVVIDPEQKTVSKDGKETTLQKALNLSKRDAAAVMRSTDSAKEYFADSVYESAPEKNGAIVVTAPFQTMRVMVFAEKLSDTYGAAEALYYPKYHVYILQYDTQAATEQAYNHFRSEYGSDCCSLDQVVTQDTLQDTKEQDTKSPETASCYSWGATLMGLDHLKAEAEADPDGSAATVAILDTGIDATNELFAGKTILSSSRSFIDAENDLTDGTGHGTHVAGIVADCTPDNVKLLILRVFNAAGESTGLTVFAALEYAISQKADVINLSLGWGKNSASASTRQLIDPAISAADHAGIPIFCAAGNYKQDVSDFYPACNSQTIAVSSLKSNGTFDSAYSDFGAKIDFSAPGVDIASAKAGGQICIKTGTSMAAPHLSAAAAYIKLRNPGTTVAALYQVLKRYAVDAGKTGKDDLYGWGYVNLSSYYDDNHRGIHHLSDMTAALLKSNYICDGKAKNPPVTVWENGVVVPKHNYFVTYQNNTNVGTATVTITGINNYQGSITKTFSIALTKSAVSSAANTEHSVSITWSKIPGASGYYIYQATAANSGYTQWKQLKIIPSGKIVSWIDKKVSNGDQYRYMVRAYCDKFVSAYRSIKTIYHLIQPTIYRLKNAPDRALTITWNRNRKATGYQLQYSPRHSFISHKTISVLSCKTDQKTIKQHSKGRYNFVRIRSYKQISGVTYYSAWSATKGIKLKR